MLQYILVAGSFNFYFYKLQYILGKASLPVYFFYFYINCHSNTKILLC